MLFISVTGYGSVLCQTEDTCGGRTSSVVLPLQDLSFYLDIEITASAHVPLGGREGGREGEKGGRREGGERGELQTIQSCDHYRLC